MEKQEFFEHISRFYDLIKIEENLRTMGLESISLIQEPYGKNGLNPTMIFRKPDKTEYSIKGEEQIIKYLDELENIIKSKNKKNMKINLEMVNTVEKIYVNQQLPISILHQMITAVIAFDNTSYKLAPDNIKMAINTLKSLKILVEEEDKITPLNS